MSKPLNYRLESTAGIIRLRTRNRCACGIWGYESCTAKLVSKPSIDTSDAKKNRIRKSVSSRPFKRLATIPVLSVCGSIDFLLILIPSPPSWNTPDPSFHIIHVEIFNVPVHEQRLLVARVQKRVAMASYNIKDILRQRAEYSVQTAIDANAAILQLGWFPPRNFPINFNRRKWSETARVLNKETLRTPTVVKNDIDMGTDTDSESELDIPGYSLPGDKPKLIRQMPTPVTSRSSPVIISAESTASGSVGVVAAGDEGGKRKRSDGNDDNTVPINNDAPPSKKKKVIIIMLIDGEIPPMTRELLGRRQARQVMNRADIILRVDGEVPEFILMMLRHRRAMDSCN
ncbi:hypothetical protein VTL71DRAFT_6176 [Oculimacula yallundae]|uniref:Uncharacterized protein n=1 Tax=Oculimacula yallundae TaxID=86028 RepID=A0ABR4BZM2_9HELO